MAHTPDAIEVKVKPVIDETSQVIYLVLVDDYPHTDYQLSAYANRIAAHRYARDVGGIVAVAPIADDYRKAADTGEAGR